MKERAMLRRRAGLTQAELAHRTGIHASRICLWERGHFELRPEQVERIQRVISGELAHWLRSIDSEVATNAA